MNIPDPDIPGHQTGLQMGNDEPSFKQDDDRKRTQTDVATAVAEAIFWGRLDRGEHLARSWNDAPGEVIAEHKAIATDAIACLAFRFEPFLLPLRSAVSRAEFAEDRDALQQLFDLLDSF